MNVTFVAGTKGEELSGIGIEGARKRRDSSRTRSRARREDRAGSKKVPTPRAARAVSSLLLIIFVTTICLALTSDTFRVSAVSVVGNERVSAQRIVELTGLVGKNIFSINTTETRRAIIAGAPLVTDAYLDYRLPNEVTIRLRERAGAIAWRVGDITYDVSSDGVVLGPATGTPSTTIVDVNGHPLSEGDTIDTSALKLVSSLKEEIPQKLGFEPQEYRLTAAYGISFICPDGVEVAFGLDNNLEGKMSILLSVLEESKARNLDLELIDVRFQNRPYFR